MTAGPPERDEVGAAGEDPTASDWLWVAPRTLGQPATERFDPHIAHFVDKLRQPLSRSR